MWTKENIRVSRRVVDCYSHVTMLGCVSLSGDYVKPAFIGTKKALNVDFFKERMDKVSKYFHAKSGWIDTNNLVGWVEEVLVPHINAIREGRPVLLVMDGHRT